MKGFIYTHTYTSHIHIIPISHKNYSKGYILHFVKKKLSKKLPHHYGKDNFFDTSLKSAYVIIYLVFNQLVAPTVVFM